MPEVILIGILTILIAALCVFIFSIYRKLNQIKQPDSQNLLFLQNQLNSLSVNIDTKIAEINRIIQNQLTFSHKQVQEQSAVNNELLNRITINNNRIIQDLTEKLVKVEDTNKQIMSFATQLQSLENILNNPKRRGILGEYFLETMLASALPKSVYQMQYSFNDGVIVDAVIFTKEKIIPIDAKFSLEAFNKLVEIHDPDQKKRLEKDFMRDIKLRIDETSKYIKPEENTIDVAFMFIPSDSVYQEAIRCGTNSSTEIDIVGYAFSKKVVLVSPTSFFAYMQTIIQALNTIKVEEQVLEIVKYLQESSRYLKQFEENMNKLGKNIGLVVHSFNKTNDEANKLVKRIEKITYNKNNIINLEKLSEEVY